MLALSASHFSFNSPSFSVQSTYTSESSATKYNNLALHYRILAIRGLSKHFATLDPLRMTDVERQTIQATLYSLTFQSYYLADLSGFFELLYFFRGCSILRNAHLLASHEGGKEMYFDADGSHWEQMEGRLVDLPEIPSPFIWGAERSLNLVKPLCRGSKVNIEFLKMLLAIVRQWKISSLSGILPSLSSVFF